MKILSIITSLLSLVLLSNVSPLVQPKTYFGTLFVEWAGVIDNGEGDNWPHGPHGNFYIVILDSGRDCSYSGYISKKHFPGPSLSNNGKYEWLDGDSRSYAEFPLFNWRNEDDYITIMIYESDSGWGRNHDMIFCYEIRRKETIGGNIYGDDYRNANTDAISNCRKRNITWQNHELIKPVWYNGLNSGIPKMFIQLETR